MSRVIRFLPVTVVLLSGCHLVDQRDFDANAGRPPKLPPAPVITLSGPAPLLTISYATPDPAYAVPLADAVHRALAVKPGVLFTVQTIVPLQPTPDAQARSQAAAAATGREIAEAIIADGADQGQIELAVRADAGVRAKQVRIFVH